MPRDPNNSGALFKNDRKRSASSPDVRGNAMVNGVEYWVNGWKHVSKGPKATEYLSLSFTPKAEKPPYRKPESSYPASREPGSDDEPQGDIPW